MTLIRSRRRARPRWALALGGVAALMILATGLTMAAFVGTKLPSSNFEIDTDANIKVDAASPSIDWANVAENKKDDLPTGSADNSFTQGTKEDTALPITETGSIPPNKSDLKTFGVYSEKNNGVNFVHLYWTRVQDPSGTTNMDFELNQRACTPGQAPADADCAPNGVTPIRSVDDILITYDLSKGGTVPILGFREWTGTAWGAFVDLSAAGKAIGSINTTAILAADADGLGALSARTFGEASVNLDQIFEPGVCRAFGSAYLKSRSSDSFTAALKDFIAPEPINVSNCGGLTIVKDAIPDDAQQFSYVTSGAFSGSFSLEDDGVGDGNTTTFTNLNAGTYLVTEDGETGWVLTNITCTAGGATYQIGTVNGQGTFTGDNDFDTADTTVKVVLAADNTPSCTFTNTKNGAIKLVKNTTGGDGTFPFTHSIAGLDGSLTTVSGTATDTSDGIVPGNTYAVAEGTLPAGFEFISASCKLADGTTSTGTVAGKSITAITVEAGKTTTCTFTNRALGLLKIVKNTTGGDGTFPFAHSIAGLSSSLTTSGGTANDTSDGISAGTAYAVAEGTLPAGFDFVSASCKLADGTTSTGTVAGKSITAITVEAGETTTCTFNNQAFGFLKLVKNTTGGDGTFPFSHSIAGLDASLTTSGGTANDTSNQLVPGNGFAVAEGTLPAGFEFVSASCKLADGTTATGTVVGKSITGITVEVNKTTTCTFNNRALGSIKLVKNTTGGNGTFPFTHSISGLSSSLTTVNGTAEDTSDAIEAGSSYAVAEGTLPAGFDFVSAGCKLEGGADTGAVVGQSITGITVEAGKTTTCTFTNRAFGYLKLVKNTIGGDGTFPFTHGIPGLLTSLTTVAGTANDTSDKLLPGSAFAVSEGTLPAGFAFNSASCTLQGGGPTGTVVGKAITGITVEVNKVTTCTFSNEALYKAIVLVCNEVTNDLYVSDITLGNEKSSLGSAPAFGSQTDQQVLMDYLCGLGGASFGGLAPGPYAADIDIPEPQ
jgi:hypothetical protein